MAEGIQLCATVVAVLALLGLLLDMGMNGARYASGWQIVVMGLAGAVWLVGEWVK